MSDRRKNRRIELGARLLIKKMNQAGGAKEVNIEVTDVSKTGVGFLCSEKLDIGAVYESFLTIWTKEVIHSFLEIVRVVDQGNGVHEYGAIFIGMSEMDASRIATYETMKNMGY